MPLTVFVNESLSTRYRPLERHAESLKRRTHTGLPQLKYTQQDVFGTDKWKSAILDVKSCVLDDQRYGIGRCRAGFVRAQGIFHLSTCMYEIDVKFVEY